MESQPATLTPADLQHFERDGYVVVRQAFPRADALAMEEHWWSELADTYGIRRDDRSTWRQIPGNLKAAKRDPAQQAILSDTVRGVVDDLLGTGTWSSPRDWGVTLVTFPEPGSWELPTRLWHWDNPCEPHLHRVRGLFVVSFIGPVAAHGGGTLIISGSPRLLLQQERQLPADQRRSLDSKSFAEIHDAIITHHAVACSTIASVEGQKFHENSSPDRVSEIGPAL